VEQYSDYSETHKNIKPYFLGHSIISLYTRFHVKKSQNYVEQSGITSEEILRRSDDGECHAETQ
jgi:hypothetical protein